MSQHVPSSTFRCHAARSCRWQATVAAAVVVVLSPVAQAIAEVKIDHEPVKKSKSGQRIELKAEIQDRYTGIREARAYFKSGHDTRFWFAPMHAVGKQYIGILPAPALGAEEVQYRIYAVSESKDFVKTELFTIKIKDDEDALARMEAKEPTNVEIDVDRIEQMRDLARRGGEPDPSRKVEVRNDVPNSETPREIPGFQDYIVVAPAPPAAAGAGLALASTVSVKAGGIGVGKIAVGALGLGGVAYAVSSSSDDSGDESGIRVTLRNLGVENIHICHECSTSDFSSGNRISPGSSRTEDIEISGTSEQVVFLAGRNGAERARQTCTVSTTSSLTVVYRETSFYGSASLSCE